MILHFELGLVLSFREVRSDLCGFGRFRDGMDVGFLFFKTWPFLFVACRRDRC